MAKESRPKKSLGELRQEIAHSRDRLARDVTGLKYELDIPLKFRKSVQRNTGVWISGAAVLGVLFTFLPKRRGKVKVDAKLSGKSKGEEQKKGLVGAGLALGILKFAATLAKPAVISYFSRRMGGGGPGLNRSMRS